MNYIISDLIINGCKSEYHLLDNMEKSCIGCFSCWIKTPGECIYKSSEHEKLINSKNLIIITQVCYGSYSPIIKKFIDRTIPLNMPTFKLINKELHHKARYDKYPDIHVIAYNSKTDSEEALFKKMLDAHAINFHAKNQSVRFCSKEDILKELSNLQGGINE